jgi:hypothetical protein
MAQSTTRFGRLSPVLCADFKINKKDTIQPYARKVAHRWASRSRSGMRLKRTPGRMARRQASISTRRILSKRTLVSMVGLRFKTSVRSSGEKIHLQRADVCGGDGRLSHCIIRKGMTVYESVRENRGEEVSRRSNNERPSIPAVLARKLTIVENPNSNAVHPQMHQLLLLCLSQHCP